MLASSDTLAILAAASRLARTASSAAVIAWSAGVLLLDVGIRRTSFAAGPAEAPTSSLKDDTAFGPGEGVSVAAEVRDVLVRYLSG